MPCLQSIYRSCHLPSQAMMSIALDLRQVERYAMTVEKLNADPQFINHEGDMLLNEFSVNLIGFTLEKCAHYVALDSQAYLRDVKHVFQGRRFWIIHYDSSVKIYSSLLSRFNQFLDRIERSC